MPKGKLRVVELYAGTGRSMEPFRAWRSAESALLVDSNSHAASVYRHNFPKANYLTANLSALSSDELLRRAGSRVDILLGCPPCQGYSDNGLRDVNDSRNAHMTRFLGYVRDLSPLAVAMENVPLAVESLRFKKVAGQLERLGYKWTAAIANAALWGSCQSRQRLILVAIKSGAGSAPRIPAPTHGRGLSFNYSLQRMGTISEDPRSLLGITPGTQRVASWLPADFSGCVGKGKIPSVWTAIGDLPRIGGRAARRMGHVAWAHTPQVLRRMGAVPEGGRWSRGRDYYSQTYGRLHRKGLARTITTYFANPGSGRFWHPVENRSLSLREAARIQGFPDDFEFPGFPSHSATLVGNALDSSLANLSYRIIRESMG